MAETESSLIPIRTTNQINNVLYILFYIYIYICSNPHFITSAVILCHSNHWWLPIPT